ncbi:MAG: DUF3084 domain-containing protein [Deinococcales bacterium]
MYLLILLSSLIILAGVIAYAGDRLGTVVGRKRLSLFGWRPRRTGQVVGVSVGIVIMLSTLLVLALAFRDATNIILRADETLKTLESYQRQQVDLEQKLELIEKELAAKQLELNEALQSSAKASEERDNALSALEALKAEETKLNENINALNAELSKSQAQLDDLNAEMRLSSQRNVQLYNEYLDINKQYSDQILRAAQLQFRFSNLSDQAEVLQNRNDYLSQNNEDLLEKNSQLQFNNETLRQDNSDLLSNINNLRQNEAELQAQLTSLEEQLKAQAEELGRARAELANNQKSTIFFRADPIYSTTLKAQDKDGILAELEGIIEEAQNSAKARGAAGLYLSENDLNTLIETRLSAPEQTTLYLKAKENIMQGEVVQVIAELGP